MSSKSTGKELKGIEIYLSRRWELIKTAYLFLTWIVLGIHLELVGPTLNILSEQTNVDYSGISNILLSRSGGYMTANIIGALIQNIVNKYPELLMSLAFVIASIVVFVTPLIRHIVVLSIVFFFQGISQGTNDLAGTSLMLSMWGDNVAAPLNIVHVGFGFGAVSANFLLRPFLNEEKRNVFSNTTTISTSNIEIPYKITSLICFIISIGHLILFIRQRRIRLNVKDEINYEVVKKSEKSVEIYSSYSPRSCGNGSFKYGLLMSTIWIIYMFFLSGNDQTFGKFFFAYLKSGDFNITTNGATWGLILYWLSYSIGRLFCAILTIYVPVDVTLNGLWVCGLLLAISWAVCVWFIGLTSEILFILGSLTGLVFSPTFPLSFGFINQRLSVNPFLLGFILCGGSVGAMVFQKLGGIILDKDRQHFPTLLIVCVVCAIICYVFSSIISSIDQRKRKANRKNVSLRNDEEQQMEIYLANL